MKLPSPSKYPKEMRIGNDVWTIRFVRRIPGSTPGNPTLGLCDDGNYEILIKRGQTRQEYFMTFLHELMHAMEYSYSVHIPHPLVYSMEKIITQILMDNF